MDKVRLLGNTVLVEVESQEVVTEHGLVISTKKEQGDAIIGRVVKIGEGKDGQQKYIFGIPVGSSIMFQYGTEVTVEGKKYFIIKLEDILLIM